MAPLFNISKLHMESEKDIQLQAARSCRKETSIKLYFIVMLQAKHTCVKLKKN
jgi:hypothetical protein